MNISLSKDEINNLLTFVYKLLNSSTLKYEIDAEIKEISKFLNYFHYIFW